MFLYNYAIRQYNRHMCVLQNIVHYLFKKGKIVSVPLFIVKIWQICSCHTYNYLVSCKWPDLAVPLLYMYATHISHDIAQVFY